MKRTLLVSVAAIALAIGANTAYSQGSRQGGGAGGGTSSPSAAPSGGGTSSPSAAQPGASESAPSGTGSMSKEPKEPKQKGAQEQTTPRGSTSQREEKGAREPSKQQTQGTTGSGQTGTKSGESKSGADTKSGTAERKNGASESKGAETKSGTSGTKGGTAETKSGSSSGNVSLSTEQKTQIRQTVLTSSAPRVSSVDFDVHVGTVVPRSVHIIEVPATLVTIEPRWRGYKYFVYRDEIVIIEPDTLRIVAVLVV